ncbi:MAG: DNA primase [Spirochaetales bacterium]
MRIPEQVIDEIARRLDIVALVGRYVTLRQQGSKYVGLCPFHNEKTPSFHVDPGVGAYYCFGCQRGGGVFKFLMDIEGLTFPEAVRQLGTEVGVEVDQSEEDPATKERKALADLYNRVALTFSHFLTKSAEGTRARAILAERAIENDTIARFRLGFAPADPFWLHRFLQSKNYSTSFLQKSGLFTRKNPLRSLFAGRIMFPIADRRGDVVAFGGRIIEGDGPKYINSPETPLYHKRELLYGIDVALSAIRKKRTAMLCEGYMDVIALHQAGIDYTVAPLGTAFTPEQASLLVRHIEHATLLFDADSAGLRATRKTAEILEAHEITSDVVELASGTDPADLLVSGGSQAVLNAVSSRLPILEFLIQRGLQEYRDAGPEAKQRTLEDIYPFIGVIGSDVKRDESLRQLADLVGVDFSAVRRDFFRRRERNARTDEKKDARRHTPSEEYQSTDRRLSHDLFLMLATVRNRKHFGLVRRWIHPEDLEDEDAREIYLALEDSYRREENSLDVLLSRITRPAVVKLVEERITTGEFAEQSEAVVTDTINSIRRRTIERQLRAVERELRRISASSSGSSEEELELLAEKMTLDRELQKTKGERE